MTAYSPSPVTEIDGIDALEFLLAQSLVGMSQDPDSLYNQNFFQLSKQLVNEPSVFEYPTSFPGKESNITFANGTTRVYENVAVVQADLTGIATGEDLYAAFCNPDGPESSNGYRKRRSKWKRSQTSGYGSIVPFYPEPIVTHREFVVSGYYLNAAGLEDVAVLAIYSFDPATDGGELEFQDVVQTFLSMATKAGKKKLVIDLQGNGGKY